MIRALPVLAMMPLFAHAGSADSPEALEQLPNTHAYAGPKIEAIAIYIRGIGGWAAELPKRLVSDLKENGVRAVDAAPLATTAIDEQEVLARIKEAGFANVMIVDISGSSQLNGLLMPSSNLSLQVQVRDVDGTYSWKTSYNQYSSAIGRGGKLVRAGSKHVIDAMKKGGLFGRS